MRPFPAFACGLVALLILLLGVPIPAMAQSTPAASLPTATSGDFAGLVDIGGGRRLWLECRGEGSPTVILEAGSGNDAATWDTVGLLAGSEQTAVLPGVAGFTRVCAYDRPGTILDVEHRRRHRRRPACVTDRGGGSRSVCVGRSFLRWPRLPPLRRHLPG